MEPERILSMLESFARQPVLVLGDAMLDVYCFGTTERVSREAPIPVVRYDREERRLGGAANAARNVVALGGRAWLTAVIGGDPEGQTLQEELHLRRIPRSGLVIDRAGVTLTKLRVLAGSPGTAKQQVMRLDREPAHEISSRTSRRVLTRIQNGLKRCRCAIVSDYGGGTVSGSVIRYLAGQAGRVPVVIDARYNLERFRGPFLLKPNAPELAAATGMPVDSALAVERAARALLRRTGARSVLATRGREGMTYVAAGRRALHLPVFGGDDVTDVTGAGDTVAAAIGLTLAATHGSTRDDMMSGIQLATVAAGLVVQKLGAATVTPDEVRVALRNERSS